MANWIFYCIIDIFNSLFTQGLVPGGIALVGLSILLLFPKIKELVDKYKNSKKYTIDKSLCNKLESIVEEEIKNYSSKEDKDNL